MVSKTPEEEKAIDVRKAAERKLKEERRRQQELNIKAKKGNEDDRGSEGEEEKEKEDDNADWYRREVGEEPDPGMFRAPKNEPRKEKYNPFWKAKDDKGKKRHSERSEEGDIKKKKSE